MGEIHELFVLALSLVWFAGATPDNHVMQHHAVVLSGTNSKNYVMQLFLLTNAHTERGRAIAALQIIPWRLCHVTAMYFWFYFSLKISKIWECKNRLGPV